MADPTYSELLSLTLQAIRTLSSGVKSFQIKDRVYTYANLSELWEQHDRLKVLVRADTNTTAGLTESAVISFGSPACEVDDD